MCPYSLLSQWFFARFACAPLMQCSDYTMEWQNVAALTKAYAILTLMGVEQSGHLPNMELNE